ncbi:TetR/AcrR family transcriptional regulator [Nocardiopsis flavescens]|uniref:DNA-binding transcriptional regulator, AcrR family n=1 Tax=Nocardiopsis flavescens TaxID=758803 RepID=A0A1M6LV16_9ACTN|nr:TetR/AcrR family transcriptional regulator [Nocardiopsis flavescens]SHJ74983.1 DNA-binding transcriptional regulator, AcrR family [Nocardiopsis flavescens]
MGRIAGQPYHHGDLRRAVIDAALEATRESGPTGWSLRELARRAGVSHAAPAHHFGDKAGVLAAVAAEGFGLFADALEAAASGGPQETGLAYIRFALAHRPHFEVMFRPELYRLDDPGLLAARARAGAVLADSGGALAADPARARATAIGAWSFAHGFAGLWLSGSLPESAAEDPEEVARSVIGVLFGREG